MRARSITLQLTLLFALLSTVILLGVGAVLGVLVNEHFVMLDVEELEGRVRQIAVDSALPPAVINATPDVSIPATVAATVPRTADGLGTSTPVTWQQDGRSFRGIAHRVGAPSAPAGYVTIVAATDISHHTAFMAVLWRVIGLSVAFGMIFSVPLSWIAEIGRAHV